MASSDSDPEGVPTTEAPVETFPGWLKAVGVVLVAGYAGFVVLLWSLGLFDVPKGGPDARIFAAVFALLGGLFGAVLTFAAALLKHAIDTRTLELSHQTERRLTLENSQTDARLRLETSIRAVDLLAAADGTPSPATKQAGSLFALANLGQIDLAVALLGEMWSGGDVSDDAAMWVIDYALRHGDETTRREAARIYLESAHKLLAVNRTVLIPGLITHDWPVETLGYHVRLQIAEALITSLGTDREGLVPDPLGNAAYLNQLRVKETAPDICSAFAEAISIALDSEPDKGMLIVLDEGRTMSVDGLRAELTPEVIRGASLLVPPWGTVFDGPLARLREGWPPAQPSA